MYSIYALVYRMYSMYSHVIYHYYYLVFLTFLLLCAPCRLKLAWWWTLSGSAASVWPSTVGVASCSIWIPSLRGRTPPHLCRKTNPAQTSLSYRRFQASALDSGWWNLPGSSFVVVIFLNRTSCKNVTSGSEPAEASRARVLLSKLHLTLAETLFFKNLMGQMFAASTVQMICGNLNLKKAPNNLKKKQAQTNKLLKTLSV